MLKKAMIPVLVFFLFCVASAKLPKIISSMDAEKKAKQRVEEKSLEYTNTFTVLVEAMGNCLFSFYQVHFINKDGRLVARARVNAYGEKIGKLDIGYYSPGSIFDSTYFFSENIRKLFNTKQQARMYTGRLVAANDIDALNIGQPCWLAVDMNGEEWYITTGGRIYSADKLRKEFIEEHPLKPEG